MPEYRTQQTERERKTNREELTVGNVAVPSGGLKGSSNYLLYSACNPVTDLSVTIEITESIVADCGFSFQLNGNSPLGANCYWQQYVIAFDPTSGPQPTLSGSINNWATDKNGAWIEPPPWFTFPGESPTLPAGYQLTIRLSNDASGNITSVTFTVVDNQGNVKSQVNPLPVNSALAPIYSFSLVFVGKTNAECNSISPTMAKSREVRKLDQKRATSSTDRGMTMRLGSFTRNRLSAG